MDALKDRVGAFTEGIMIMACPVLAAVALKKVDLRSEGTSAVQGSMSPLAAISLCLSSLSFILLAIASALKGWLPETCSYPLELVFRFSKLLAHLCAIAQMLLAYMILLLIAMRFEAFVAWLVVWVLFVIWCGYQSVIKSQERSERVDAQCEKKLEASLDFSAAVTSLLFLGLEGLALEGQTGIGLDLNPRLLAPIRLTFFVCVVASAVMLLATVPPIDYTEEEQCNNMCNLLHGSCGALTLCFSAVVFTIVFVLEKENGGTVAVAPYLILFLFYVGCLCIPGGNEPMDGNEVTPASLELTKVTFTCFLAVSLPSFGDGSISRYTHAFIISTAMAVLFGLAWRFLTHFKKRAAVWTAKVACLFTHGCLAAAVIPFLFVAMQALADADDECHIPCNSGSSAQLQLFIACFKKRAIETTSYALSSVNC